MEVQRAIQLAGKRCPFVPASLHKARSHCMQAHEAARSASRPQTPASSARLLALAQLPLRQLLAAAAALATRLAAAHSVVCTGRTHSMHSTGGLRQGSTAHHRRCPTANP